MASKKKLKRKIAKQQETIERLELLNDVYRNNKRVLQDIQLAQLQGFGMLHDLHDQYYRKPNPPVNASLPRVDGNLTEDEVKKILADNKPAGGSDLTDDDLTALVDRIANIDLDSLSPYQRPREAPDWPEDHGIGSSFFTARVIALECEGFFERHGFWPVWAK